MEKKKEGQRFSDKLAQRQTQAKFRLTRKEKKKKDYSYQQTAKLALAAPDTNVGTDPLGCI